MLVLPNWKNYSNTADSCVQNYIMSLKYEYNKITSDQVNKMLLHFEIGDKPIAVKGFLCQYINA